MVFKIQNTATPITIPQQSIAKSDNWQALSGTKYWWISSLTAYKTEIRMLKNGLSLSFKAKMKLHTRKPKPANSQKCASVLMMASLAACPKTAPINSVKNPLVEEDSSPFWADKTKIIIIIAIKEIADKAI